MQLHIVWHYFLYNPTNCHHPELLLVLVGFMFIKKLVYGGWVTEDKSNLDLSILRKCILVIHLCDSQILKNIIDRLLTVKELWNGSSRSLNRLILKWKRVIWCFGSSFNSVWGDMVAGERPEYSCLWETENCIICIFFF